MNSRVRKLLPALAVGVLVVLAFGLGRWTHRDPMPPAASGQATLTAPAAAEVWTCSMHPQVRQPSPGKCPLCAMDLIRLAQGADDDDDGDLPRLRLGERALALMQIRTAPVVRGVDAARELRLPARIEVDETARRSITARFSGRIERLHTAFAGAAMIAGAPLLDLYSPELLGAQEELLQARALASAYPSPAATALAAAAAEKLLLLGVTPAQIDELAAHGTAAPVFTVLAPATGIVLERRVAVGDYVTTGDTLFLAADLSVLWVQAEAYEDDLAWLQPGQEVALAIAAHPGEPATGTVAWIDPVLDPVKRTARVRIELSNTDGRWRPGLLAAATVRARPTGDEPPLVVPATAPLLTGRRAVVYVREPGEGRPVFSARTVELGPRLGEVYVVRQGLAEGELVVVHGQFKLDSELQIRGRPSMMTTGEPLGSSAAAAAADPRTPPVPRPFAATVAPAFGRELVPVVAAYLDFVAYLAADDPVSAGRAATELRTALERIGPHRLADEAHLGWREDYERLHHSLRRVPRGADLAALRAPLQDMTLALEAIYVTYGAGQLPPVRRAHCPMVEGGVIVDGLPIGTWLQRDGPLANPYWGAAMLTCGEFHGQLP
jgi:Cu(I)/Ag(I) efflux system membrane fusion protein